MEKTLVLYQSKYGASRWYAEQLAAVWDGPAVSLGAWKGSLQEYGRIVFAGGLYAGNIAGLKRFFKLCGGVSPERLAVLCVGASPYDAGTLTACKTRHFGEQWQAVPLFYARGRLDMARLAPVDRALCRMLCRSVSRKDPAALQPWMQALLAAADQPQDWTSPDQLQPLLVHWKG